LQCSDRCAQGLRRDSIGDVVRQMIEEKKLLIEQLEAYIRG
jgi:hypothetical protein